MSLAHLIWLAQLIFVAQLHGEVKSDTPVSEMLPRVPPKILLISPVKVCTLMIYIGYFYNVERVWFHPRFIPLRDQRLSEARCRLWGRSDCHFEAWHYSNLSMTEVVTWPMTVSWCKAEQRAELGFPWGQSRMESQLEYLALANACHENHLLARIHVFRLVEYITHKSWTCGW